MIYYLLQFSKMDTLLPIRYIVFLWVNAKKSANFDLRAPKFSFSKNLWTLKIIFYVKIYKYLPFTVHQWVLDPPKKLEIKNFKHFIKPPKMVKMVFDLDKGKIKHFWVSLYFKLVIQSKKTFPPGAGSKNVFLKHFFVPI